jgi:hypothetical protein
VVCLRELLLELSGQSKEAAGLAASLVLPCDHSDYAQVKWRSSPCQMMRPDELHDDLHQFLGQLMK